MQIGDLVRTISSPTQGVGMLVHDERAPRMGILLEVDGGYHPAMVLWFGSGEIGCVPSNRLEVICK